MKILLNLFLVFFICNLSFAQEKKVIKINDTTLNFDIDSIMNQYLKKNNLIFYEDSLYLVRRTCRGEWGGSVWFKNKNTGIEYSCQATCPLAIYKIDQNYFVICNLNHLSSMARIIKIANPERMEIFQLPKPLNKKGKRRKRVRKKKRNKIYYIGDSQSNSIKGTKSIIDTTGISIFCSFLKDSTIYTLVNDYESSYIGKILNGKLIKVQSLPFNDYYQFYNMIQVQEYKTLVFFKNKIEKGYIEVFNETINIYRTKIK